jgi:hypothetical protein
METAVIKKVAWDFEIDPGHALFRHSVFRIDMVLLPFRSGRISKDLEEIEYDVALFFCAHYDAVHT